MNHTTQNRSNFFCSPKAYMCVVKHSPIVCHIPKILSRWYRSIDAEPGFTQEDLNWLRLKSSSQTQKKLCSLVTDIHGYVDFGSTIHVEAHNMANEALVCILVAINDR